MGRKNVMLYNTTPPYVVVASGTGSALSTQTIKISGITTSNIQLIIITAGIGGGVLTLSDTQGNVYSGLTRAGTIGCQIAYVIRPLIAASMSFTIANSATSACVLIVQGPNPPIPAFDVQNGNGSAGAGGGHTASTGNITPNFNGDFIVAAASTGTGTIGTGATVSGYTLINLPFQPGVAQGLITYYQTQKYILTTGVTFSSAPGSTLSLFGAVIGAFSN